MAGADARKVTLNADAGESIGIHSFGNDEALLDLVDIVNVACGMHAGGPSEMNRIVEMAATSGVRIGAHPGLPDLGGFGRRKMSMDAHEVRDLIRYQVGSLCGFLSIHGAELNHIKPHGALYSMLASDEKLMHAACDVAEQYEVPIFGLPGTIHQEVAHMRGVDFVAEFFVDLDYNDDGTLIVNRRGAPQDLQVVESRARQALEEGIVVSSSGKEVAVQVDSLCVHSDLANAQAVATSLRRVVSTGPAQG